MSEPIIGDLVFRLSLDEKVRLLTGKDFWTTVPLPSIGLRSMVLSDGPSGVRGEVWDERSPSLNLPSATTLSSSWDSEIARLYGVVSAQEARRKGVDIVLGPTINLHRSPLGGRHFEAFSEDPRLTADLAAAYVTGVQAQGVAATPKHYVANDFEVDRFTVDVRVDERPLRELYLLAFEKAVTEAHAWLVMSAYNSVNGATATENDLLEEPLNGEWGFDGVVVSDWTAVRSVESAKHSQDLVMPGPVGAWGEALVAAVRSGEIDEATVDRKVARLLVLASRVGALDGFAAPQPEDAPIDGIAFARRAATEGAVLLRNEGELPWASAPATVAVIGHNAKFARSQGGGSATVIPEHVVSPLEGITSAFGDSSISYSVGAVVQQGVAELPLERMTNPATGEPGLQVRFFSAAGKQIFREDRRSSALVWFGGAAPLETAGLIELTTNYLPELTGTLRLGFAAVGTGRVFVDDALVLDETVAAEGTDLGAALLSPPSASGSAAVTAGVPIALRLEFEVPHGPGAIPGALGLTFGIEPDNRSPDDLIAAAVAAASAADVALVVVGTNSAVESEGLDRKNLSLPGRQDDLVRAVAAANPRTVVIVNSGSPVLLPWRNEVAAIVVGYFGGQEFGNAIADILTGVAEPGGRLPTTWPATEADVPVLAIEPVSGVVEYSEGIHIGYRAWLESGAIPAYEFGHGLGYTTWNLESVAASPAVNPGEDITVTVRMNNTGSRAGKQVVQVYAERANSAIDRPVRWLVGFAVLRADAGETATASVSVPARALAHWADGWQYEAGDFTLRVGTSVSSLPSTSTVRLRKAPPH